MIGILLQYCFVFLIYYFLLQVIKIIYKDLKSPQDTPNLLQNTRDASSRLPQLIVVDSGAVSVNKIQFILGESVSIGRYEGNDIVISDRFVSHEHACIAKNREEFWLSDLNSTNLTYLNGQCVTGQVMLKNGDMLKIGAVTFKFVR